MKFLNEIIERRRTQAQPRRIAFWSKRIAIHGDISLELQVIDLSRCLLGRIHRIRKRVRSSKNFPSAQSFYGIFEPKLREVRINAFAQNKAIVDSIRLKTSAGFESLGVVFSLHPKLQSAKRPPRGDEIPHRVVEFAFSL
jgi:hypothetical protein